MNGPVPDGASLVPILEAAIHSGRLVEAHELLSATYGPAVAIAAQRALTARIRADVLGEPEPTAAAVDVGPWQLLQAAARALRRAS